jgi:TldD protein
MRPGEALLDPEVAERVLARALASGGEFAEVFAERRQGLTMAIDESRIESVQSGAEEGAGVRVLSGGTTYFAHVDGLEPAELERAAAEAAAALRAERAEPRPLQKRAAEPLPVKRRPEDVPAERKAELLRELDERGRAEGGEIAQLQASYAEGRREVAVANSEGLLAEDDRTRVRIGVQRWRVARTVLRPAPRRSAAIAASSCSKTSPGRSPPAPPARR